MNRIKKLYFLALLILICSIQLVLSDDYEGWLDHGDVALKQALVDLTNDMTIACLAAHPDDEDGATLTYYRKKFGANTAIILATRGEGGQNEIGPELYEELGVIRAFETQAAANIYGAKVYNLNKRDFGFSKSAEEAFKFWDHDDSLRRLVRAIREIRPDVIITNHDTETGHGHHQACGIMILEAFDAAADPERFPDHFKGLEPWQVKRLFVRCGENEADVRINVGEYDQIRGLSYAQLASEGLKMHKSQGMGGNVRRGDVYRYYKLVRSTEPIQGKLNSLYDGLASQMKELINATKRDEIAESLVKYIKNPENDKKEAEMALARALDLYLTVLPDDRIVTRGQKFNVQVSLANCGNQTIEDIRFELNASLLGEIVESENLSSQSLGYNETATGNFVVEVSNEATLTMPYPEHLYDDMFIKPLIQAVAHYRAYNTELSVTSESTVDVVDDMAVNVFPKKTIIPLSDKEQNIKYVVNVTNQTAGQVKGNISFNSNAEWNYCETERNFDLKENQQAFVAVEMTIPPDAKSGDYEIEVKSFYEMLDTTTGLAVGKSTIRLVDVKTADDLYTGYVKSYDNTLEWALNQLSVKSKALEPDDVRFGDLSAYDTIILDIRAYLVRQDLVESNQRFLDYVKNGGNLIVMYNKTLEWKPEFAPYKLIISRDRVTVEESPIIILAPDHPLFSFPNKITSQDWDGWIQERGLYFPSEWSPEYKELLSCNDPGETPLLGGYLIAQYGKGTYIYTSYVWYRQLQELNPGAFRNFANMISLPKYKAQ